MDSFPCAFTFLLFFFVCTCDDDWIWQCWIFLRRYVHLELYHPSDVHSFTGVLRARMRYASPCCPRGLQKGTFSAWMCLSMMCMEFLSTSLRMPVCCLRFVSPMSFDSCWHSLGRSQKGVVVLELVTCGPN